MKKVLFLIIGLFLFIPIYKAETYITDYNDIDDYISYIDDNYSFKLYNVKRNDNNILYLRFNKSDKKYSYRILLYDKDYNEIGNLTSNYYSMTTTYIDLKDKASNAKYYKFAYKFKDSNDSKDPIILDEELSQAIKITPNITYSNKKRDKEEFYIDNININIDVSNIKNNQYNATYNYQFNVICNKDIENFEFELADFDYYDLVDENNTYLSVLVNDKEVPYDINDENIKGRVIIGSLKKGNNDIKISFKRDLEYSDSYGIRFDMYKNIYNNNLIDNINLNIHTDFKLGNESPAYFCGYEVCYTHLYDLADYDFSTTVKGHFEDESFDIFIIGEPKEGIFDKYKNTKLNYVDYLYLIIIVFILLFTIKPLKSHDFKKIEACSTAIIFYSIALNYGYVNLPYDYKSIILAGMYLYVVACIFFVYYRFKYMKTNCNYLLFALISYNIMMLLLGFYLKYIAIIIVAILTYLFIKLYQAVK